MTSSDYDAIVIGGGPAGSTAGNLLAQKGRRVLVLEKDRFPRHHIGESLLPGLNYVYRRLGVEEALKRQGFFVKTGGSYLWGRGKKLWSITFRNLSEDPRRAIPCEQTNAYHVERAAFDQLLLKECGRRGAEISQPAQVIDADLRGARLRGLVVREGGKERRVRAKLYVDASGQGACLQTLLGWRRFDPQLRNMALYSYFDGARLLPPPHDRHIFVASAAGGWFWYIPLSRRRVSVGYVTSVENAKLIGADQDAYFRARVRETPRIARLLAGARRTDPYRIVRDWSYRSRRFAGENFLLAGDAAAFIDPLLSYGVTLAMHSAALAADCAGLALRAPARREEVFAHYEKATGERFRQLLDFVKYFYDGNRHRGEYFWRARRIARHSDNAYAQYAFTYLVSGYPVWNDRASYPTYFGRFFKPLGAPTEDLKRDARFLRRVRGIKDVRLALIDEALPPPPRGEEIGPVY